MTIGDFDFFRAKVGIIFSGNTEVDGVDMNAMRAKFRWNKTVSHDFIEEFGWPILCDSIQSSAEFVIIDLFGGYSFAKEAFKCDIVEEFREKIKMVFNEPQAVE